MFVFGPRSNDSNQIFIGLYLAISFLKGKMTRDSRYGSIRLPFIHIHKPILFSAGVKFTLHIVRKSNTAL
jgi:hypothetical protein